MTAFSLHVLFDISLVHNFNPFLHYMFICIPMKFLFSYLLREHLKTIYTRILCDAKFMLFSRFLQI